MRDSTCEGVALSCTAYAPVLAHIHTKREDNSLGHMKAGGGGQNARQRYLETKEQHLLGVGGDAHLGFNMLIDPACEGEKEA